MPNTRSIILENWPGPKTTEPIRKPVYHLAVKQHRVSLDFHIKQVFHGDEISIHLFDSFESLVVICQRYTVDAIIIGSGDDYLPEIELVRLIKRNVFLSIIPVILYHPEPEDTAVIAAYENGAEDFIRGDWLDKLVKVRIRKVIARSRRDLAINPSTLLPGPAIIEREVYSQIKAKSEFAVCYADLDNFKAYNDYYGYTAGDKVIRLTARIVKDVVFDLCRGGFVGHVAGDDFIIVIPHQLVDDICSNIIKAFDTLVPFQYEEVDRERGHIMSVNRRGATEQFPLLTISIAVIVNRNGTFEHPGELSKMLADLKTAAKAREGSNYMVERRAKY
ncbi:MAG: diguanylate cyclase [Candidatus Zixiibacteriota bacterium]